MKSLYLKKVVKADNRQSILITAVLVIILAAFGIMSPYYLKGANLASILVSAVPIGLIAIGEGICLLTGNFDMSPGMVASLAGIIWAQLVMHHVNTGIAFVIALIFGALSGIIAGFCVAYLKITAFIATYALMLIWESVIDIVTGGEAINMYAYDGFKVLGQTRILGSKNLTLPVLILIICIILFAFLLKYTKFGRRLFIIGGNPEAAKINGINVKWYMMIAFVIMGILGAMAGLLFASRSGSVQPVIGSTYAMQGIEAAVVGGTKMEGGKFNAVTALIGVLIIMAIQSGLNMFGLDSFYQYIVNGLILFVAVWVQTDKTKE